MRKMYAMLLLSVSAASYAQVERTILIETFTSSTCGPCNSGNSHLEALLDDPINIDRFVSLKYQMDWPGTGDPYFTSEGNSRRTFYSISSIPYTWVDATTGMNSYDLAQADFDLSYAVAPGAEIVAYYQVTGQTVDVQVDVKALTDLPSSVRLFIAVFEYETDNNIKTNGETEFFHVMKKMLPNSTGTSVSSCLAGDSVHIEKSHTFVGSYVLPPNATDPIDHTIEHSVEGFADLGVAVWLQRTTSKEVYQSTYAIQGTAGNAEELPVTFARIYPNPANETSTLAYDLSADADVRIEIYNSLGQLTEESALEGEQGRNYASLSTGELEAGIYMLKMVTANGIFSETFCVQH